SAERWGPLLRRGLWLFVRVYRIRQSYAGRTRTRNGDWTGLAGWSDNPYCRCLGRPGVHLGRGPEVGRLPHGPRRADGALGHPDWRSDIDAFGGATIDREADRASIDVRGPSCDRDRNRAPVRGH